MIRLGILTISDRSYQGIREDLSGPALQGFITTLGWHAVIYTIVPDEIDAIKKTLIEWCDDLKLNLILTSGGTGLAPRDVTPEATIGIIDKDVPGLQEYIRSESTKITPHAILSRGAAGIRNKTLIINLPGSPRAAIENMTIIKDVIPHAIQLLSNAPESESGHQFTN